LASATGHVLFFLPARGGLDLAPESGMETADVRGKSFAGAHLPSASLAGFDLRGTDLSGADLHDADLSMIRSGMTRGWAIVVVAGSLLVSVGLGVIIGLCAHKLRTLYLSNDVRFRMLSMFVGASLIVFLAAGVWRGLSYATRSVLPVTAALAVACGLIAIASGTGHGAAALVAVVAVALAAGIVMLGVLVRSVAGTGGQLMFAIVAIAGGLAGGASNGGLLSAVVAVSAMLMARRESKSATLSRAAAAVVSRHGTSFRNANLAGARFNGARLVACDFRGANLRDTHFDRNATRLCRFDKEAP
jgi:hypothetical protein